jgi:hypothetical protein
MSRKHYVPENIILKFQPHYSLNIIAENSASVALELTELCELYVKAFTLKS